MAAKVAIYARVSTVNHGQDVSLQTRELRQFAEARGWTVAGEYIDSGVSGAKDSRPELNHLMADAHKRRFDVVCVALTDSHVLFPIYSEHWRLSRLSELTSFHTPNKWTLRLLPGKWSLQSWVPWPS
jgi:predicted site-specific integrase-resolvase